jgi:hypothetical protein
MIYWTSDPASGDSIYRIPTKGGTIETMQTLTNANPYGIDLDLCSQKMYWTESPYLGKILRADMTPGATPETLLDGTDGLSDPQGFSLDVQAGKMYWSDVGSGAEGVYRADTTNAAIAASTKETIYAGVGADDITSIALDLVDRKIYWINTGDSNIVRANLDGSGREVAFVSSVDLSSVAIDQILRKIYWTTLDPPLTIVRANLDFSNIEELITIPGDALQPQVYIQNGIDSSGGSMYWVENDSTAPSPQTISRANLPEKPVYDNGFVTHAIPQCSLQYSWIKASAITDRTQLLGYQNSGSY